MKEKIAIVGFSQSSRHLAPYDSDDFEIWGCNHVWKFVPRVDVLFELHHEKMLAARYKEHWDDYRGWMTKTDIPIYMQEEYTEYPTSRRYPIEEMKKRFSFSNEIQQNGSRVAQEKAVFKSTISYMMALAIARQPKPKQINLYGIDMVDGTEWGPQRPDLMRFIGHARESGITVVIPEECALFREGGFSFYAYDESDYVDKYDRMIKEFQKRIKHYEGRMAALDKDNEYALAMTQTTNGAAQAIEKLIESGLFKEHKTDLEKIATGLTQGDRGWP
jgi:hypothetical protein